TRASRALLNRNRRSRRRSYAQSVLLELASLQGDYRDLPRSCSQKRVETAELRSRKPQHWRSEGSPLAQTGNAGRALELPPAPGLTLGVSPDQCEPRNQ